MKTIIIKGPISSGKTLIANTLNEGIQSSLLIRESDFDEEKIYNKETLIIDDVKDFDKYENEIPYIKYLILIGE